MDSNSVRRRFAPAIHECLHRDSSKKSLNAENSSAAPRRQCRSRRHLRNARGGARPDPVRAALTAIEAGADGITAHLREDRRHIRDTDMARLKAEISKPLNFEMAATEDMLRISLATKPHAVCLVPERREELTTEGGLDVVGQHNALAPFIARLNDAGIRVSLFIAADPRRSRWRQGCARR
jgi:pyridoxine 5'-phosphate synthase